MKTAVEYANAYLTREIISGLPHEMREADYEDLVKALTDYAEARYMEGLRHGQDDAKEELEDTRNAAFEEAAKVAEAHSHGDLIFDGMTAGVIGNKIRALKHSEATPGAEEKK